VARSTNTNKAKPTAAADPETASMTFEHAMQALEAITDRIESGEIGLEQSMAEYERGMRLIARCREVLDTAEQRVAELSPPPHTPPGRDARS
jgi:exodeoxyribonuclease VII small subunit